MAKTKGEEGTFPRGEGRIMPTGVSWSKGKGKGLVALHKVSPQKEGKGKEIYPGGEKKGVKSPLRKCTL